MIIKPMLSTLKTRTLFAIILLLFISSLSLNAQRKSKNNVGYGIYSSGLYTNSGYGVNYDLNLNVMSNKQRFGVGLVMVTSKEILSGADAYYRYTFFENPRIFTKRAIVGLEFFMQAQLIWRATPVEYSNYEQTTNSENKPTISIKNNKDYISAIEFVIGPGVHYWIDTHYSVDLSLGIGRYVNSPKFGPWDTEKGGASGIDYSCRIGVGYRL